MWSTWSLLYFSFFFFNHTAPTEIYTLSLHDALPIYRSGQDADQDGADRVEVDRDLPRLDRSEEHTSELQSRFDLVCRLLLEKKKKDIIQFELEQTGIAVDLCGITQYRLLTASEL